MVRTTVIVSGGGTNLQAIIDGVLFGEIPNCELAVVSSNPEAYALTRAQNAGVPAYIVDINMFPNRATFSTALFEKLRDLDTDLVVLAGFTYVLDPQIIKYYSGRIINIHPSLIPSFSGKGFYGLRVHEQALIYGVKLSGATAHFATEEVDAGPIIIQKAVEVLDDDTPKTLQRRIMEEAEWKILPQAVALFCEGRLRIEGRNVKILPQGREEEQKND